MLLFFCLWEYLSIIIIYIRVSGVLAIPGSIVFLMPNCPTPFLLNIKLNIYIKRLYYGLVQNAVSLNDDFFIHIILMVEA